MNFKTLLISFSLVLISGFSVSAYRANFHSAIEAPPQQTNPDCKYPPCD
ncbi:hypothetical protein HRE53_19410 [Acaryochloris sp. 'Moss Beach']|nr:hypothetical protein [Acaryochloris sp. 'Moss Beach']UJB68649.1 hypothetical protein HRE53_19410 [Acaryochloris sp. 'Moss Beach']